MITETETDTPRAHSCPISSALKDKHTVHEAWGQSNEAMDDMHASHQILEIKLSQEREARQKAEAEVQRLTKEVNLYKGYAACTLFFMTC